MSAFDAVDGSSTRHVSAMDVGADKAPTIRRSYPCKRSRQSVSILPSRYSDEELGAKVHASFLASDRTYGARRVWHDMLAEGVSCGLHRIERLMQLQALKALSLIHI